MTNLCIMPRRMQILDKSYDDNFMTKLLSQICDHNFVITLDYDCFSKRRYKQTLMEYFASCRKY